MNKEYTVTSLNTVSEEECQRVLGMTRDEAEEQLLRELSARMQREIDSKKD